MNLTNNPNINNNINNIQKGTLNSSTTTNLTGTLNVTGGLEQGQVIQGEIIDLKNNEISLVLQDGRMITGKLTSASSHAIGDKVSLSVVDVSPKNLTLKIIETSPSSTSSNTIDKALEAAFLSKNDRNRTIIKELLNNQMSIDKASIQHLIKQSVTFKYTDITTLVLMNKYNIPVTEGNIEKFIKFMNMEQNMLNDLNQLSDSIINVLKENSQTLSSLSPNQNTTTYNNLLDTNKKLMNFILRDTTEYKPTTNINLNSYINNEELTTLNNYIKESSWLIESNKELSTVLSGDNNIADILPMLKELTSKNIMNVQLEGTNQIQSLAQKLETILNNSHNYTNSKTIGDYLNTNELNNLGNLLKGSSFSESVLNEITSGTIDINKLLTMVKESSSIVSSDVLKETFASKELQTLLKEALLNKWTITPEDIKEKEHIKEHMDSLLNTSLELKDLLKESLINTTHNAVNQTIHVQDNLNFINHINQLFHYIPLPLKLQNKNANGELYVYSNKRSSGSLSE